MSDPVVPSSLTDLDLARKKLDYLWDATDEQREVIRAELSPEVWGRVLRWRCYRANVDRQELVVARLEAEAEEAAALAKSPSGGAS